jgi:hypothetical protein
MPIARSFRETAEIYVSEDTACAPDFETANDEHCVIGAVGCLMQGAGLDKRHDADTILHE